MNTRRYIHKNTGRQQQQKFFLPISKNAQAGEIEMSKYINVNNIINLFMIQPPEKLMNLLINKNKKD
jgi:hypothetical protein